MPIPLSQLMASDDPELGPPETVYELCLSAKLFDQLVEADERYTELEARVEKARERSGDGDEERPGPRRRQGHKPVIRDLEAQAEEAAAVSDAIRDRMAEKSAAVRLVLNEDLWRAFATEHPARDVTKDPTGAQRDRRLAAGHCNIDALLEIAPEFIGGYGDEPATPDRWEYVKAKSAPGDRDRMASVIVQIHTQGVVLGKSRLDLRHSRRTAPEPE